MLSDSIFIKSNNATFIIRSNFIIFPDVTGSKRKQNPSKKVRENVGEQDQKESISQNMVFVQSKCILKNLS